MCQAAVPFLESRRAAVWSLQSPRLHQTSDWRIHHYHRSRLCCSHKCLTLRCSMVLAQLPEMYGRLTWLSFRWSVILCSQCMYIGINAFGTTRTARRQGSLFGRLCCVGKTASSCLTTVPVRQSSQASTRATQGEIDDIRNKAIELRITAIIISYYFNVFSILIIRLRDVVLARGRSSSSICVASMMLLYTSYTL